MVKIRMYVRLNLLSLLDQKSVNYVDADVFSNQLN